MGVVRFNEILTAYKIKAECVDTQVNDNYLSFDLKLLPGGKVRDITKYSEEISLSLKTFSKPTFKVITKNGIVRVGFIKENNSKLILEDIAKPNLNLNCTLGKSIDGKLINMDLSQNPHMIIAGATGSGKSILLQNIIYNILNNKSNNKLILMDPKNIEFCLYSKNINNVYVKNYFNECLENLKYLSNLMDYRYKLMVKGVEAERMPYITLIIDEFADLIMQDESKEFYTYLCRLAQMGRAARIHIILATQRPTVDVINGTIKANFPTRIACRVASAIDSRVVLDTKGAENLIGKGDALLKDNYRTNERFQVAYIDSKTIYDKFSSKNK